MSKSYIPPFPNSNSSADTQYTQHFENFRVNKRAGGAPEPVLTNPKTPPNPRRCEPDPPQFTASPLHQSYLVAGKSPIHQGNGGNSSHGSSRQGNAHKHINPNHPSYASPGPSKNSGSGRPHEGLIGYGTPGRNTPSRNKKMPSELYDDLVPPFPSDGTDANYTEVFSRYKNNMSATDPQVVPYTPRHNHSPKLKRCSCFGL